VKTSKKDKKYWIIYRIHPILLAERKNFVIGLIIWLGLLTTGVAVSLIVIIGKFSRMERGFFEENQEVFKVFENLAGSFAALQADFKDLLTKVKTLEENPSEVLEQIEQLETRFSDLTENLENLEGDVKLLLHADKEHPVLVPNKGGRPRNEKK